MSATFAVESDTYVDELGNETLNVSNANLYRVLRSLDIEPDYCGSIDGADLEGRILLALAVGPKAIVDTADPATKGIVALLSEGGACVVDCSGPLDEYLASRLPVLLEIATRAAKASRAVQWG